MSTVELHLDRGAALMAERSHRSTRARLAAALLRGWGFGMVVIDSLVVLGAFLLAHWARFILPDASGQAMGLDEYARIGLIVSLITVVLFAMNDLYDTERSPAWPVLLRSVLSSISTALVLAVAVSYFLGDQAYSRLWFASGWLFAVVSMLIWRSCAHRLYEVVRDSQAHTRRILIVGSNPLGDELARELASVNHVVGFADNGSDLTGSDTVPLLGPISDIERLVHSYGVDELVIALPPSRREQVSHLLERGFHRRVTVKFLPYMEELLPHRFDLHDTAGRRYIRFWSAARVSWFKRAMDLILVSAGLLMLLPLLGLIALAIKLDSPGPVFYGQTRVGQQRPPLQDVEVPLDAPGRRPAAAPSCSDQNEAIGPLFKITQRSTHDARRRLPAPLEHRRAAAAAQRAARRHEPGRPAAADPIRGGGIRRLAAGPPAGVAWADRTVASQRPQRSAVPRHGAPGPALHPQLVGVARSRDPAAHRARGPDQSRRVLRAFAQPESQPPANQSHRKGS